jgi:hypothetical protein
VAERKFSKQLREGVLVKFTYKGDLGQCKNDRVLLFLKWLLRTLIILN